MKTGPLVSVVMTVYNGQRFLAAAIESVLKQSFSNFEFIIVDDGSSDQTPAILKKYAQADNRIKVLSHTNRGVAKSCNRALKLAKGKYIARHDADDLSDKNRFQRQVDYLETHPDIVLLGSNFHVIDADNSIKETTDVFTLPSDLKLAMVFKNNIGQGTVMFRKSILKKSGDYNPVFLVGEDYDLWNRMSKYGQIANLVEPLYHWRSIGEGLSTATKHRERANRDVEKIRNREFSYFAGHRAQYRHYGLHLLSTRLGPKAYLVHRSRTYRRMAWFYSRTGYKLRTISSLLMATLMAPWQINNYRLLLRGPAEVCRHAYDQL